MIAPGLAPAERYAPTTKCCTFIPQLPNFVVGAMIQTQPERIETTPLHSRTPLGMIARPEAKARFEAMVAAGEYGQDPSMRCPYLNHQTQMCDIWATREAQCSTYVCRYVHGWRGVRLWQSVLALLRLVEAQLARWCVREQGLDLELAGGEDERAWGPCWGREAEFYRACAEAVDGLDEAALSRIMPTTIAMLRTEVLEARAELGQPIDRISLRVPDPR